MFFLLLGFRAKQSQEEPQRVVKLINDPLLERNDCVVRNCNVFRTDLGAALGDIAKTDTAGLPEFRSAILDVQRVHFQGGGKHEEARADELFMLMMVA